MCQELCWRQLSLQQWAAIFIHQLHFQPSGPGTEEAQHRIARGHGNGKLELVVQETAGWAGWKRWNCEEEAG